jgi:hypothetical protein
LGRILALVECGVKGKDYNGLWWGCGGESEETQHSGQGHAYEKRIYTEGTEGTEDAEKKREAGARE